MVGFVETHIEASTYARASVLNASLKLYSRFSDKGTITSRLQVYPTVAYTVSQFDEHCRIL